LKGNAAARIARVPFTISHAAAVLPLRGFGKFRLPLVALMIGSMSPDFAYFLPGEFERVETHSFAGLFWFSWPVSLGLWLLYVRVLEQPTFALLPDNWHARFLPSDRALTFTNLALASSAAILGAATHLVWDSFTHRGTVAVDLVPALHSVAFHYHGWRIRWFLVLQHVSTVVGMLVLVIWAWRLPPNLDSARALPPASRAMRMAAIAVIVATASAFAITGYLTYPDTWFARRLFHFAVGGMTGFALAWIGVAVWLRWRASRVCV
jgi:Domain of unknown function (DUF4184)